VVPEANIYRPPKDPLSGHVPSDRCLLAPSITNGLSVCQFQSINQSINQYPFIFRNNVRVSEYPNWQ